MADAGYDFRYKYLAISFHVEGRLTARRQPTNERKETTKEWKPREGWYHE